VADEHWRDQHAECWTEIDQDAIEDDGGRDVQHGGVP
jgi:hypothetical protein